MAHPKHLKDKAFMLYLVHPHPGELRDRLKREGHSVSLQTLQRWINTPDPHTGDTWQDRQRAVDEKVRERMERDAEFQILDMERKFGLIQNRLIDQILDETAPKIKSLEGATYAVDKLGSTLLRMHQSKHADTRDPAFVIRAMLRALRRVPEVERAMKAHWKVIEAEAVRELTELSEKAIPSQNISILPDKV